MNSFIQNVMKTFIHSVTMTFIFKVKLGVIVIKSSRKQECERKIDDWLSKK